MADLDYCDHGMDWDTLQDESWPEYDARGIYLFKVCQRCARHKLATIRPDVLADPQYEADEPIDEDT